MGCRQLDLCERVCVYKRHIAMRTSMFESEKEIVQFSRVLLESAPDAIIVVDSDGCMVLVNAMTEQLFGYSRRELVGEPVELLIPERYHEVHRRHRKRYSPGTSRSADGCRV